MRVRKEIRPAFAHVEALVEEIAAHGVPSDATLIYEARNRVYTLDYQGISLNIKAFRPPSFPNNFVYNTVRRSKARRSMENALRLKDMGFETPEPVAYIEITAGDRLTRSYYISVQEKVDGDFRLWLDNPAAQAALPALASELVRLHRAGVWHKDFSPGNVMFRRDAAARGGYRLFLIDLNRMQFGVTSKAKLHKNFGTIYLESEAETGRFGRLYAAAAGVNEDEYQDVALNMHRQYVKRKKRLHAIKKLFKK